MKPLFFGPADMRLFGWLHPAPVPPASAVAVLLCKPFGFEAQCAHQSMARMASDLAHGGWPALRFDYVGSGDSDGDEFAPEQLQRWIASVHLACDFLKAQTGATQLVLVGLRLGATLAALAALERTDIAALVAIAPVVHGRKYLRELMALGQLMAPGHGAADAPDAPLQAGGFLLTRATCAQLAAINLSQQNALPAPDILLVARDDIPGPDDWAPALLALGARLQRAQWPGYGAMMVDPINSRPPEAILTGLVAALQQWQERWRAQARPTPAVPPALASAFDSGIDSGPLKAPDLSQAGMRHSVSEQVLQIDTGHTALTAILSQRHPGAGASSAGRQRALIVLNSGAVHHIGQNRMWVRIAREWAQLGVVVLRLDLSGIGDSPRRPGAEGDVVYSTEAASDLDAAIAYMRQRFPQAELQLLGLCSGAYHAFKAAARGQPIQGALLINPLTFHSWRAPASGALQKLARGQIPWRRVAQKARGMLLHLLQLARAKALGRGHGFSELGAQLLAAQQHGIALHFVFAVGEPGLDMLLQQSGAVLQQVLDAGAVSIDSIADADHTFTRLEARERLLGALAARYFGTGYTAESSSANLAASVSTL